MVHSSLSNASEENPRNVFGHEYFAYVLRTFKLFKRRVLYRVMLHSNFADIIVFH